MPKFDFTLSSEVTSAEAKAFKHLMSEHSLIQLVPEPTRGDHILDLVLTNIEETVTCVEVVDGIPGCDHDAIIFTVKLTNPLTSKNHDLRYNFKKADMNYFNTLLSEIPWAECFGDKDIEEAWATFKNRLFGACDKAIPKTIFRNRKRVSWLSEGTFKMIQKKRRAYRLYKRSVRPSDFRRYRLISNAVRNATRIDHQQYIAEITKDLKSNQKRFWQWLKNKTNQKQATPAIVCNGTTLESEYDKAKAFNNFFSSIFTIEKAENLPTLEEQLVSDHSSVSIDDLYVKEIDVYEQLCKVIISKACGSDGISGRILKAGAVWLAEPLTDLFNLSLQSGSLPMEWKQANITPVYKKGNPHSVTNYRPISLTSLVVKILERLILFKLNCFLSEHGKLKPFQHGFRANHSCQTQLLSSVHDWAKTINNRSSVHAVFLDFSKAFDSVLHQRLLLKLDYLGIRGHLHRWIESFLTGRSQRVVLNGKFSSWTPVVSGVPQGSILGPLLFILYINDLSETLTSTVRIFADDSTIYREVLSLSDCILLQEDLDTLSNWTKTWQLPLNIIKCKAMCLSNKRKVHPFTYHLNGTPLDWCLSHKYLGIMLNTKLLWNDQVAMVVARSIKVLNLIRRTMFGCSKQVKLKAYLALVRPTWNTGPSVDAFSKILN